MKTHNCSVFEHWYHYFLEVQSPVPIDAPGGPLRPVYTSPIHSMVSLGKRQCIWMEQ